MNYLTWKKCLSADKTEVRSYEATVCRTAFAGLVDEYVAVVLPNEDGTALVYIRRPHGQPAQWRKGAASSVAAAKRWARAKLAPLMK